VFASRMDLCIAPCGLLTYCSEVMSDSSRHHHVGATGHVWSRAESGPAATTVSVQSAVGQKTVSYSVVYRRKPGE
jgi:hypothetical protein